MVTVAERSATLIETRNLKMARSSHAYVRGSTAKFYEWLEESAGKVRKARPCGFAATAISAIWGRSPTQKGRVAIQIRDLDQTVIGNPAHDLIRLGLSLASAARGSDLPGTVTARIVEQLVSGYEDGLSGDMPVTMKTRVRRASAI